VRKFESKETHTSVTPENLSERWWIGLGQARETLKRTAQRIVRSAVMPLARRYRADRIFEKRRLRGKWFTDTLDGRVTSKDRNRYSQVFANRETLKRTTQRIVKLAIVPLARRYRADQIFEKRRLRGKRFTDTLDGRVTSKDGNWYGQVFANRIDFATVYPMDTKRKAGVALRTFCQEFGVPDRLTCDGSKEQNGKKTTSIST